MYAWRPDAMHLFYHYEYHFHFNLIKQLEMSRLMVQKKVANKINEINNLAKKITVIIILKKMIILILK